MYWIWLYTMTVLASQLDSPRVPLLLSSLWRDRVAHWQWVNNKIILVQAPYLSVTKGETQIIKPLWPGWLVVCPLQAQGTLARLDCPLAGSILKFSYLSHYEAQATPSTWPSQLSHAGPQQGQAWLARAQAVFVMWVFPHWIIWILIISETQTLR